METPKVESHEEIAKADKVLMSKTKVQLVEIIHRKDAVEKELKEKLECNIGAANDYKNQLEHARREVTKLTSETNHQNETIKLNEKEIIELNKSCEDYTKQLSSKEDSILSLKNYNKTLQEKLEKTIIEKNTEINALDECINTLKLSNNETYKSYASSKTTAVILGALFVISLIFNAISLFV